MARSDRAFSFFREKYLKFFQKGIDRGGMNVVP